MVQRLTGPFEGDPARGQDSDGQGNQLTQLHLPDKRARAHHQERDERDERGERRDVDVEGEAGGDSDRTSARQETSQSAASLPQLHINTQRGLQFNMASLGLLTFALIISIALCLAPVAPAAAPVQHVDVRQMIAVVFSVLLVVVAAACWLQRRIWENDALLLDEVSQTFRPQASVARFLHELLVTFSDAFTGAVPTIQPKALARIGLSQHSGQLVTLVNQVLRQIQVTVAELSASEQARLMLQREQAAVEMITKYLQRQPQVVGEQLWRSVLTEKAQRGVVGLMAESLYVGNDSPLAALLVQALQARDAAILQQLLHEEEIRHSYATSIREVCDLTLAGSNVGLIPQDQRMAQELGDLMAVAKSVNGLLDHEASQAQFFLRVRQALQTTIEGRGSGASDLKFALEMAHPSVRTDLMTNLISDLQTLLERLERSEDSKTIQQSEQ